MIDKNNLPRHVAIIMDGNGRWAKERGLPRVAGHQEGVKTLREVVIEANKQGIELLTVYAFSTENWQRPSAEVNFIMNLPGQFFDSYMPELLANNVKIDWIGDETKLPKATQKYLYKAKEDSKNNTGLCFNIAINYGGRQEITKAVKEIASDVEKGLIEVSDIDEILISDKLMTGHYKDLADPDLLIRTSGEQRLSNFLLWQLAYSELYFTDVYWPDFKAEHLQEALLSYQNRDRRYGGLK